MKKVKHWQDLSNYRHLTEQEDKEMHPSRRAALDLYMDMAIKSGEKFGNAYTGRYAKSWEIIGDRCDYDYFIEK